MTTNKIEKMSIDKKMYYDVMCEIDIVKLQISFSISIDLYTKLSGLTIADILFEPNLVYEKFKNLYLRDKDGIDYSCLNCIFKINTVEDQIKFVSVSIDKIITNVVTDDINVPINKVTIKTRYIGCPKYAAYIKNCRFNYTDNIAVNIEVSKKIDFNIDITIVSKTTTYDKLSSLALTYIELILLCFGEMPLIENIVIDNNIKKMNLFLSLADKYVAKNRAKGNNVISVIDENTINKQIIKNFLQFRKKAKIIYDIFMVNVVSDGYIEMKNCQLLQVMEGLHNSITGMDNKLYQVLNYYFLYNKSTKKILTNRDKSKVKNKYRTPVFLYKCQNQRNYLSHLNQNQYKNVFVNFENIYAYSKIFLCLRIIIADIIGLKYDISMIEKRLVDINSYYGKKVRLSHKLNSDDIYVP